jgi:TonB family protein
LEERVRAVLNASVGGALLAIMLGTTGVAQDQVAPMRVGSTVQAPVKTRDVPAVYPPEAQRAGVQGTVLVEVVVGADGRVTEARVLRPVALLDQAALDAVRQWEFAPTLLNGTPVSIVMIVTVNFTLDADASREPSADPALAPSGAQAVAQPCAEQPETPERAARARIAVRFAEEVNSRQRTAAIARQVRRYMPLEELPGAMVAPSGWYRDRIASRPVHGER